MAVKISVIITSFRFGGIDIMLGGLKDQTLRDFELVFVDELFNRRRGEVEDYAERLGVPLVHIPAKPHRNPSNPIHLCEGWNKGLTHARGKLVMCNNDYMWLPPTCLERHWIVQERFGFRVVCGGIMNHYDHWPLGDPEGLLTVFDRPHEGPPERLLKLDDRFPHHVGVVKYPDTRSGNLFPNCTLPLGLILELNGFDERYDAGHGFQDDEFTTRARLKGATRLVDTANENRHVDHSFAPMPREYTPINIKLYQELMEKVARGVDATRAPNPFDLYKLWEEVALGVREVD